MPDIILKKSSVTGKVPLLTELSFGEVALNYADGKLYYKTSANVVDSFRSGSVDSVGGFTGVVTAANLLTAIQTVDGSGSLLDADLLDGNHASAFYLATNPSGYLTTESDTLTSVTTRGASTTNNIAIGTASVPSTNLEVVGGVRLSGAAPTQSVINPTGTAFTPKVQLAIQPLEYNNSGTVAETNYGLYATSRAYVTNTGSMTNIGAVNLATGYSTVETTTLSLTGCNTTASRYDSIDIGINASLIGMNAIVRHNSTLNASALSGTATSVNAESNIFAGTVLSSTGLFSTVALGTVANTTASIDTRYGIRTSGTVGATSGIGTATLTTYYDAYLGGITVFATGTVTNKYGIFQAQSDHINSFAGPIQVDNNVTANRLISTVAIGTPPLTVTSTTVVPNLNASLLEGNSASAFYLATNPSGYTTNTGTVTSVSALTLGTTGTDVSSTVANSTTTPVITLNIPTASAANRGALSADDWTTFNNKQPAGSYLTSAVTTISFGTTGLTPSTATNGVVTVAGTLAAANGGTGITTPGTTGNVLTSTGTGWVSQSAVQSWIRKTTSYTAVTGDKIIADTSGGSFTITLPATPTVGNFIQLVDGSNWTTNNLTVARNGSTIEGSADDLLIDVTGVGVEIVYDGTTWELTPSVGIVPNSQVTFASEQTLTNKRVTPRVNTNGATTTGTITPTGDLSDQYELLGLTGTVTVAIPSGTPTAGQKLTLRIKDNGTSRTINWTTTSGGYRIIGTTLPTATTASKNIYVGCVYNSADVFWDVVAVATEA